MKCGDVVSAKLSPLRTDDLTPQARAIIGQTFIWTAMRIIDETNEYAGQMRMQLDLNDLRRTGMRWAPLCDLADITVVDVDGDVAEECRILHVHSEADVT